MAFVWTTVSAGKVAITTHINEAKNNIDTLADNLSAAHYSWTEMPVAQDEEIGQPQIQELQDATDYIDTVNTCSAENSGFDGSVDIGVDSSVNGTADTAIDNTADTTAYESQNSEVDSGQDTGIDTTAYSSVDSNQHATYYATRNSSVDGTQNVQALSTFDNGVYYGAN